MFSFQALLQFHKEIQIFAVALHRLKETMEPTNFNVSKRNEIIDQISMEMKAVMCELEALVNYTCRNLVVERVPTTYINQFSTNWASSTDLTLMCTQDRGVLTAYKDFIFGWKHVFRNIKRRNGKLGNKNKKKQENTHKQKQNTNGKQKTLKEKQRSRHLRTQNRRKQNRKNRLRKQISASVS